MKLLAGGRKGFRCAKFKIPQLILHSDTEGGKGGSRVDIIDDNAHKNHHTSKSSSLYQLISVAVTANICSAKNPT